MSVKTMMRASVAIGALTLAMWGNEAEAQTQPIPPEHYTLDPRGVDLVSGGFNYVTTEVVIGQPGAGGLTHARQYIANEGWRDVEVGGLSFSNGELIVSTGLFSATFVSDGAGGWKPKYDDGSTLSVTPQNTWLVTDRDGNRAVINYRPDLSSYSFTEGPVQNETAADGTVTTYHWKTVCRDGGEPPICLNDVKQFRLQSITNNRGYQLKFFYQSNTPSPTANWLRATKVVGLNMAVDYCDPMADSCPTFSENWPSVTYAYTGSGLTSATDQSGRVTSYTYSAGGLASVRYPDASHDDVAVSYNASPDFRVNAVTDASGSWTYGYSISGATQTTSVTGPLGQALTVLTDTTTGRPTSVTDALSRTWSWQYDTDLRATRVTQPEGDFAMFEYDDRSNLIKTTWIPKTATVPSVEVSSTYPADCSISPITVFTCNKPESTTDARGAVTDYEWDEDTGQLVSMTLPAPTSGAARPQTRYSFGNFQARYHDSATTFVNGGNISLPTGTSACITGNPQTSPTPICITAANEVVSGITYPSSSTPNNLLPVSASRGSGVAPVMAESAFTYTSDGDVASVNDPLSGAAYTVNYIYDDARQVIGVIGPDPDDTGPRLNSAQRLTYNDRGQVELAETGTASGGVWANFVPMLKSQTDYDEAAYFRPVEGRQLSAAGSVSGVQQVSYDAAGRPSCTAVRMNPAAWTSPLPGACTATDVGGFGPDRIAQVAYDAVGRVVSTTTGLGTADALTESVSYTPNGLPASLTDGNGNISVMEYDALDRLSKLRYPNPSGGGTSTTDYEAWTWNSAGQPNTSRNRAGQSTGYTWDLLGRLITYVPPSGTPGYTAGYDNLGRLISIASVPSSITVNTAYDALSRPISQSTTGLGSMGYSYDTAGRMTRITWPDAVFVQYDHDVTGAVTAVRENGATSGAGVLVEYAYNDLGLLTAVARADGAGAASAYGYDAHARLTGLAHDASGTANDLSLGFGYNPAGQITTRTASNNAYIYAPSATPANYARNGLNQVTAIGGLAVTYDANQNANDVLGADYDYDAAGRLTSADAGAGASTFVFDPLGRLARADDGTTTRFQYAGVQLIAEYDGSGTLNRRHVPGLGLDRVAVSYEGSGLTNPSWLLADERGSVVGLAGGTAVVGAINRYDEYGMPATGNTGRFQYTGQAWLAEAGAYHYRARAYLPQIGRFLQTDPIGYEAGANIYAYVNLDPVNFIDPWGLQEADPGPVIVNCPPRCEPSPPTRVVNPGMLRFGGGEDIIVPEMPAVEIDEVIVITQAAPRPILPRIFPPQLFARPPVTPNPLGQARPPLNPRLPPGEGWEWRGPGPVGTGRGQWYNERTGESLRPDFNHPGPVRPHYDYQQRGNPDGWRWYMDGTWELKIAPYYI
jgi:RHS repeat-associated protein